MKNSNEKFYLTLSPKYIPHWTKWAAFRELMQNVIDRNHEYDKAEIIFTYNPQKQRITIGNKLSSLEKKTLLLGETTKAENRDAIGKYGEGYKLALLVFLRMGTRVRIRTSNEIWAPAIEFSPLYETELLTISIIPSKPSDNLLFELDGITPENYKTFKNNCLYLNQIESKLTTHYGDILLDDQYKSKLFVEGLFVCEFQPEEKFRYGYNLKSRYITLDRDRQKVGAFNLKWITGQMFNDLDSTYANLIYSLQKDKYEDVSYYEQHAYNKDNLLYKALCSLHYNDFVAKYGKHVIPVQSEEEANFVKQKYNNLEPVVLEKIVYEYVTGSSAYIASSKAKVPTQDTPYLIVKRIITRFLSGKDNKKNRDGILEELLPLARQWKIRNVD